MIRKKQASTSTKKATARTSPGKAVAASIDAYLAPLPPGQRAALERLRRVVHEEAPSVEEVIRYGLPAFRLLGGDILYFGAASAHCALYGVPAELESALEGFETSGRGTVRFTPEKPLPMTFVRQLIRQQIARVQARAAKRG